MTVRINPDEMFETYRRLCGWPRPSPMPANPQFEEFGFGVGRPTDAELAEAIAAQNQVLEQMLSAPRPADLLRAKYKRAIAVLRKTATLTDDNPCPVCHGRTYVHDGAHEPGCELVAVLKEAEG